MRIKQRGFQSSPLNKFDLLGYDETSLSKAFAYILSMNPKIYFRFIRYLGVSSRHSDNNFRSVSIEIEKHRSEGRTDIEFYHEGKHHIIVECKIGKNRIKAQRHKYLPSLANEPQRILCFITQERDCNREIQEGIEIQYLSWHDVLSLVSKSDIENSAEVGEFVNYITKGFKMRDQKEILIQDLSAPEEIVRYKEFNVYKRDVTFGSPLYFAPYFTRPSGETEGISSISKVLGVLTITPSDILSFKDELLVYANNDEVLVDKWLQGVTSSDSNDKVTFYFLASSVFLQQPLMKDGGREKGRGKGWIAGYIPKNRCVTFEEFIRRMNISYIG